MGHEIDKPEIARRLRILAKRRGMDANEIGRRGGMMTHVVGRYLSGEIEPRASNLFRLLDAMAVTPQAFMDLPAEDKGDGDGEDDSQGA